MSESKNIWMRLAICFLWWIFFPLAFPHFARKYNIIHRQWIGWLLVLISPGMLFVYLICLLYEALTHTRMDEEGISDGVPAITNYHNSTDLLRATGVEFPDVTPVDSAFHSDWNNNYIRVKFVPTQGMTKKDFEKLDKACIDDSCCWRKDSTGYIYDIYPELPLDRTKGSHRRVVESKKDDGTVEYLDEWDGSYVSVFVPFNSDTITIEDGWVR